MLSTLQRRQLPTGSVIKSLLSIRDARGDDSFAELEKEFDEFLEGAMAEEVTSLAMALALRNQGTSDADSDGLRPASAIEWVAGNTRAITIPGSSDGENEPIVGWASMSNEKAKAPAAGAAV